MTEAILTCTRHKYDKATHYMVKNETCTFFCKSCREANVVEITQTQSKMMSTINDFHESPITKIILKPLIDKLNSVFCHPNTIPELTNMICELKRRQQTSKTEALIYFFNKAHMMNEMIKTRNQKFSKQTSNPTSSWQNIKKKIAEVVNAINTAGVSLLSRKTSVNGVVGYGNGEIDKQVRTENGGILPDGFQTEASYFEDNMKKAMDHYQNMMLQLKEGKVSAESYQAAKQKEIGEIKIQLNKVQQELDEAMKGKNSSEERLKMYLAELQTKRGKVASLEANCQKIQRELEISKSEHHQTKQECQKLKRDLVYAHRDAHETKQILQTKSSQLVEIKKLIKPQPTVTNSSTSTQISFTHQQLQTQQSTSTSSPDLQKSLQLSTFLPSSEVISEPQTKQLIRQFFTRSGLTPTRGNLICRLRPEVMDLFEKQSQNLPNVLVVVRTGDGVRLGGYTSVGWTTVVKEGGVKVGFLFSVDKREMLKLRQNKWPSSYDKAYGPIFGEGDLRIQRDGTAFSTVGAFTSSYGYESEAKMESDVQKTFMAGKNEFTWTVLEIYQISFEE